MPLYDFCCEKCGKKKEVIQSFYSESPLCCGETMRRLPSYPAKFEFKFGGVKTHSEGYKKGYAENYRRRLQDAKS